MGTFAGISGCNFAWIPPWGNATSAAYSDNGTTQAALGAAVQRVTDVSGAGNHATQTTGAQKPISLDYGTDRAGDGSQAGLHFSGSQALAAASTVCADASGNCTVFAVSRGVASGFIWGLGGGIGLWSTATGYQVWPNGRFTGIAAESNGSSSCAATADQLVSAVRFRSSDTSTTMFVGVEGKTSLATGVTAGANRTGLVIGALDTGGDYGYTGDIGAIIVFATALTDAQITYINGILTDLVSPAKRQCLGAVLYFGDSRGAGYNSGIGSSSSGGGTAGMNRPWPAKCSRILGQRLRSVNTSYTGYTIAQELSVITGNASYTGFLANTGYTTRLAAGEIGINDIRAGTSAATVLASLQSFCTSLLSAGATSVLLGTIAPCAALTTGQQTVRATVNAGVKSLSGFPSGVTVVDNGADTRLADAAYTDSDNIHFQDTGYGVYAQNFATAMRPLLGQTPAASTVKSGTAYDSGVTGTLNVTATQLLCPAATVAATGATTLTVYTDYPVATGTLLTIAATYGTIGGGPSIIAQGASSATFTYTPAPGNTSDFVTISSASLSSIAVPITVAAAGGGGGPYNSATSPAAG